MHRPDCSGVISWGRPDVGHDVKGMGTGGGCNGPGHVENSSHCFGCGAEEPGEFDASHSQEEVEANDKFGIIWVRGEDERKERDVFRADLDVHLGAT